jgi:carboxymethylenebutenolidase
MTGRDGAHSITTRRNVLAGALGGGFALAVRPVSAETITTSSEGLEAGEIRIPTSTGDVPADRAHPDEKKRGSKKVPLVLVVQEIFGVHEHMREACAAAKKTCEIVVYPEVGHAFNADYRPSYRPDAAKDGWASMLAWFRAHGVG